MRKGWPCVDPGTRARHCLGNSCFFNLLSAGAEYTLYKYYFIFTELYAGYVVLNRPGVPSRGFVFHREKSQLQMNGQIIWCRRKRVSDLTRCTFCTRGYKV